MVSGETREKLIRVCAVLNRHGVDYLVVGGAAVNFYGHRRPSVPATSHPELTIDLDFWYNPTIENFHKLVEALGDLEVDTTELKKVVFDPKSTYLKIPHDTFHTDFLPIIPGVSSFRDCKRNAEKANVDGTVIPFISYSDLIQSKLALNRKIDKSDIDELDRLSKGKRKGKGI